MARPAPRRRNERPAKKVSLSDEERGQIDYRNPDGLSKYLSAKGRIKSRRQTGLSRRDQNRLAREVKRSRELALLPYVVETTGTDRPGRGGRGRD